MKVTVYAIPGCSYCDKVVERLKAEGYNVSSLDIGEESNTLDARRLEDIFECRRYPKVAFRRGDKTVFVNYITGKKVDSFGDIEFEYYTSLDNLVSTIKK
jgi:glutaredoxin